MLILFNSKKPLKKRKYFEIRILIKPSAMSSDFGSESKYRKKGTGRMASTDNLSVYSTISSGPESKYHKMKKLVAVIKEYLHNSTEEVANLINRYLQALSVTIDVSIFDPHTNIATEFFVSLYELMGKMEDRSPFGWYCIEVLSNACRNSATRQALISFYQFIPLLSRMVGDQMSKEKKLRLLKLLQDLTCGIKISWQIPHLAHLMTILSKWVESSEEDIAALSLGVLVNLCYKNLPAIYTLTSNVDIKKFMKTCITMRGPVVEAHACKLMFITNDTHNSSQARLFHKLVFITFHSLKKALEGRDYILLRQLVEFFIDVKKADCANTNGEICELYENGIDDLLIYLNKNTSGLEGGQGDIHNLGECISLIFLFIHNLMEMKLDCLRQFYPKFVDISLQWIQNDIVSPQSIAILKTVAMTLSPDNMDILKPLSVNLPIFLLALETGSNEDTIMNTEHNKKIGALLQLLRVMLKVDKLRERVVSEFKEETMYKVFNPIVGEDSPRVHLGDLSVSSEEAINMYIHALALVADLATFNNNWIIVRENLLQQRQIHYVLSHALFSSPTDVKSIVLGIASSPTFPKNDVADCMTSIQNLVNLSAPPPTTSNHVFHDLSSIVPSITQTEKLDEILDKLKAVMSNRNYVDISTSEVMELYEFKLSSMAHAERAATVSVEAASERCAHLQHRTTQLMAEMKKLHHILLNTQQKHEELLKRKQQMEELLTLRTNSFEAERGRTKVLQSRLSQEEKKIAKLEDEMSKLRESREQLEEQQTTLKTLVSKLEENCARLEKNLQKKEEALKYSASKIEDQLMHIKELEQDLKNSQQLFEKQGLELEQALMDLKMNKQVIETITKVAQGANKRD